MQLVNDDQLPEEESRLNTSESYLENVAKPFGVWNQKLRPHRISREATVLSLFGGLGTEIVALKKLRIAMEKIIYCETDKVATHAFRDNHDNEYQKDLNPRHAVECVILPDLWDSWMEAAALDNANQTENLAQNQTTQLDQVLAAFLEKHGPMDIVVGGPPCGQHSSVNAFRKGTKSTEGSYLLWMGRIVRKLERMQLTKWRDRPLFFVAENVQLRDADERNEVTGAFEFDFDPIHLDAQYLSPVRRNRHYWTNIPLASIDYKSKASMMVRTCVYDSPRTGWSHHDHFCAPKGVEHVLKRDMTSAAGVFGERACVKANCPMASTSRLDDEGSFRTFVFQKQRVQITNEQGEVVCEDGVLGRPLDVIEREALMGFPHLYVIDPGMLLLQSTVRSP